MDNFLCNPDLEMDIPGVNEVVILLHKIKKNSACHKLLEIKLQGK